MTPGPNLPGGGSYGANLSKRQEFSKRKKDPGKEKWGAALIATVLVGLAWWAAYEKDFQIDKEMKIALGVGSVVVLWLWERAMNAKSDSGSARRRSTEEDADISQAPSSKEDPKKLGCGARIGSLFAAAFGAGMVMLNLNILKGNDDQVMGIIGIVGLIFFGIITLAGAWGFLVGRDL